MAHRLQAMGVKGYENGFAVTLHPERLQEPLKWRKPSRVFVCSMGDLFHDDVPWNFQYKAFEMMLHAPRHTFVVLTKRAAVMQKAVTDIWLHLGRNYPDVELPLKNVIGMVTAENQEMVDVRIPVLLNTPFALRGVSVEPMLGPVDFGREYLRYKCGGKYPFRSLENKYRTRIIHMLDWVICGGESGTNARPMHPDWARNLRDQCASAGVPFFFKQWGEYSPVRPDGFIGEWGVIDGEGRYVRETTAWNGRTGKDSPSNEVYVYRVGKRAAGRTLDGEIWNQYPKEEA
jgi:protein gp37